MDWREIPSLSALRGFEAAARLKSLSAAARSLNVTHAAIAQHVRTLEDHFGCPLLVREGRGMSPTVEGARLAEGLAEGFGKIASAVHDTVPDADRPLRIAMTPSFAENWLMPAIGQFWAEHPEIKLELLPSTELADMRAEAIDLAIRYGRGQWPGTDPVPLASANLVAFGAPGVVGDGPIDTLADLKNHHWILDQTRSEERLWASEQGVDLDAVSSTALGSTTMLLQAVRSGAGIAILPEAILERDIEDGRLVAFVRESCTSAAYHLVRRPGAAPHSLEVFIKWLRKAANPGLAR
jgi:LysR family glycine cleavage system transcriptional activator